MSDKLKKLTGKNPKDFEPVAFDVINIPDVELFKELIDNEDFLFDFIKQNVANRLAKVCNSSNYLNLLQILKYYSPSYEDVIISNLVKFSDEDLTDKMLAIFEDGTDDEKTYCAKYFSKSSRVNPEIVGFHLRTNTRRCLGAIPLSRNEPRFKLMYNAIIICILFV